MWRLDETNRLRVENYKMLKKMIKKFIKVNKDSDECYGAVGITCEELKKENISIRVIDLYSIKPVDQTTLKQAAKSTRAIITVEDHFAEGGLGEAVKSALAEHPIPIYSLAVRKMPKSGKPGELLDYEEISKNAIISKIRSLL